MLKINIPGKLYLIGEYNVLHDGKSAILFTLDRYIKASITKSEHFVFVNEKQVYPFEYKEGQIRVEDDSLKISESALQVAFNYLGFLNIKLKPFCLTLTNELVSKDGIKFGLGSSAAILIAILKSVLLFHEVEFNLLELFKIAVLGQYLIGNKTSGGDLAACTYGGVVFYTRYDYKWLKDNLLQGFKLIKQEWPLLEIESLPYTNLMIKVGWTNSAHTTDANLASVLHREDVFLKFTEKANVAVLEAKEAIIKQDYDKLGAMMSRYQALLYKLDFDLNLGFNSEILNTLIKIANEHHGYSKISGAGYGDCGISLCASPKLDSAWKKAGIIPLKYKIANPLKED